MKKIIFKNGVINIIFGLMFFVAAVLAVIGLLGIDKLDYLNYGLRYVIGVVLILFSLFNLFFSIKKGCGSKVVMIQFILNAVIIALGFILLFEKSDADGTLPLIPALALGIAFYAEGSILILENAVKKGNLTASLIGILILTLGVIIIVFDNKVDNIIRYTLLSILFLVGLFYLIAGIVIVSRRRGKEEALEEDKIEEKEEPKKVTTMKKKEIKEIESKDTFVENEEEKEEPIEEEQAPKDETVYVENDDEKED